MIKKLVRYGNSNALVIDRAILELLGIGEGSLVKLSTDGKSLTITPETTIVAPAMTTNDVAEQVGMNMASSMSESMKAFYATMGNDSAKIQQAMDASAMLANPDYMAAIKKVTRKYADDQAKMLSSEARDALDVIMERYAGNHSSPEFIKEAAELTQRFAPNLLKMQEEINALNASFGLATAAALPVTTHSNVIDEVK